MKNIQSESSYTGRNWVTPHWQYFGAPILCACTRSCISIYSAGERALSSARRLSYRGYYSAFGARALAAAAEPYACISATGAWLSRAPRQTTGTGPAVARRFAPRLCGFCLSHSAAPAPLESAAIPIRATLSRAAPGNTRCLDSVRATECSFSGALRLTLTLLSLRVIILCTEYNLFSKFLVYTLSRFEISCTEYYFATRYYFCFRYSCRAN